MISVKFRRITSHDKRTPSITLIQGLLGCRASVSAARVKELVVSKDKRSIIYNDFLTLSGIPPEVFDYRLGNRSALEWIIDQYQVSADKRSGITNDPNRDDDPQYIVRLIGQVISVGWKRRNLCSR